VEVLGIVLGIGTILVVLVALVLGRQLSVKLGSLQATVAGIDRAVNHRAEGEPPLVEQADTAAAEASRAADGIAEVHDIAKRTEQAMTVNTGRLRSLESRVAGVEGRLSGCEGELHSIRDQLAG
jgi:hypothetical protein